MRTGSEGSRRTEDELRTALPMLERHAPSADVVLRAVREGGARRAPGLVRYGAVRLWPGWLAPVAAAAAVAGVIIASLVVSGLILRPAGTGPANSSGVFAKVPRYFVAIPEVARLRAVVGATATGAVRGPSPRPRHTRTSRGWQPPVTAGHSFSAPHPSCAGGMCWVGRGRSSSTG